MRFSIRSVATIWYGRIAISFLSDVNTQYFVSRFSSECLAKKVLAKSIKSGMGRFSASAHQEVNSKLWLWFFLVTTCPRIMVCVWSRRVELL